MKIYTMFLDRGIQHQKDINAPYKFNMICFLKVFFLEPGKMILKFTWKNKQARIARKMKGYRRN